MIGRAMSPQGPRARLAIFGYHQVLGAKDPLRPDEPDSEEFQCDVEVIRQTFNVLKLPDAVDLLVAGKLPERAACITFDDGYTNNYEIAAPILERAGVPATFFVATRAIEDGVMWNDLIIDAIAKTGRHCLLNVIPDAETIRTNEIDVYDLVLEVIARMKYQPLELRQQLSVQFYEENTGCTAPRLMMDANMVVKLNSAGFDIGGHTINHPILQELTADDANAEIAGCRDWLVDKTGKRPRSFAYPNGIPGRDFSGRDQELVEAAGFDLAVTTQWALARPDSGRYIIPRVGPWWRQGRSLSSGLARSYLKSYL